MVCIWVAVTPVSCILKSNLGGKKKKSKAVPVTDLRSMGLWDVKDPTLSRQSAHR
jgi:hypothetical protein